MAKKKPTKNSKPLKTVKKPQIKSRGKFSNISKKNKKKFYPSPVKKNKNKVKEKEVPVKIVKPSDEQMERLIKKGRLRGFVTETELLYLFPEVEENHKSEQEINFQPTQPSMS